MATINSKPTFSDPWRNNPQKAPPRSGEPSNGRIAHTLTACTRCRQRKSKCDPGIPRCEPCQRSNAKCVYYDPARDRTISRTYILQLRDRIRMLNQELAQVESEIDHSPDAEIMVRGAGLIKFKETDESRFLGPSSGIAITRLVMEMAKQNTDSKSIKEVVNETTAQEIKYAFTRESQKPTSKIYPMISSVAEPELPPRELTYRLVDIFMAKAQYMLPTLHEPSFRQEIDAVLEGSNDPCQNFQARLVIAISMQKLSPQYAGLADSYYLAALPFLDACIKRMDVSTLQCFALIAQYSLLTPTRTAAYWVVGVAVKLCQDLGLTDEATITKSSSGPMDCLELDMRRRMFWIITSMEYGLSHSLGRPSAFGVTHDHINVKFFSMVDDRFITRGGMLPGAQPIMKKCIAIHFFKMRLLQAEIRRTLYLKKRETPLDDQDPWFINMLAKLDHWVASCPKNDEGSGLSEVWFQGRRNTMIVFMFRPSPQVPEPSLDAARKCYDASIFNVKMHRDQVATRSVDLTWIFTQSVFMALNTILWSLSYPTIRQEHPIEEVMGHISIALEVLAVSAERWPGVESALQLYRSLISGCLRAYGTVESFVVHSPSNRPSPSSSHEVTTPPHASSPSSAATFSVASSRHTVVGDRLTPDPSPSLSQTKPTLPGPGPAYSFGLTQSPSSPESAHSSIPYVSQPIYHQSTQTGQPVVPAPYTTGPQLVSPTGVEFDPNSLYNTFPSVVPGLQHWDPNYTAASTTAGHLAYANASVDPMFWIGSIGDQYSQYFNQPYPTTPWRGRSLSQEEHMELMAKLVENPPEVSFRVDESTTYYNSAIPPSLKFSLGYAPPIRRLRLSNPVVAESIDALSCLAQRYSTRSGLSGSLRPLTYSLDLMSTAAPSTSFHPGSPPSPSSPLVETAKRHQLPQQYRPKDQPPHTPTSPPLMSVGSENYASSFSTTQTSPAQTLQSAPLSSPPCSVAMSTQVSQQPTVTTTTSFPTPASSVGGHFTNPSTMEDTEMAVKNGTAGSQKGGDISGDNEHGLDFMAIDASGHRRTDHDRQKSGPAGNFDTNPMDLDSRTTSPAQDDELSLASLQQDMGTAFHLCKNSYTASGPSPNLDLVSLYGLGPVAASVARTDPVTGEKINRLRKSYEGKIKGLGLAGRNKAVKTELGAPTGLRHLTLWPEEEWQNQKVYGKDIKVAEPESSFFKQQLKAMKLEPGILPNHEFWEDALGHEKPPKVIATGDPSMARTTGAVPASVRQANRTNGAPAPVSTPGAEPARPKRSGKKRSYNDSSFVGYGEGFPDDDAELESGRYSNSEESGRGQGKKKRKKDHISGVSPTLTERGGSYGVGMFGVGAR
ncbi:hypothetical protein FQN52_008826 [Onygenales sp. PD_12]|nr:hypothetical protein FQN52_008826 [Onygenales sp. PD_12]